MLSKLFGSRSVNSDSAQCGAIDGGRNKVTGGHDHRSNRGDDRTPSQKEADAKRRGSQEK